MLPVQPGVNSLKHKNFLKKTTGYLPFSMADVSAIGQVLQFFYHPKDIDAEITFVKDGNGKATKFILHQNGKDHVAEKIG